MRSVYLFSLVVVVLGSFVWFRTDHPQQTGLVSHDASSVQAAKSPRYPEQASPNRNASAARAIRSPAAAPARSDEDANRSIAAAVRATRSSTAVATPAATAATSTPPPKPAAELFTPMVEDDPTNVFLSSTVQYHAAVRSEAVDADWAPAAADALRDYIASQFGDRFEIPLVDCRTDLCEIRIAGRIGGDIDADMRDLQQALFRMQQEPWWATLEFDQQSGAVGVSPDHRALALWFVSRR